MKYLDHNQAEEDPFQMEAQFPDGPNSRGKESSIYHKIPIHLLFEILYWSLGSTLIRFDILDHSTSMHIASNICPRGRKVQNLCRNSTSSWGFEGATSGVAWAFIVRQRYESIIGWQGPVALTEDGFWPSSRSLISTFTFQDPGARRSMQSSYIEGET